ncbi:MAG: exodeoxyribonuclease VII small subunit [Pseudomonadota bacterium]|nr:exodeoxyribonuclease VII small subunit [Pseudomonadota bacterium]MEC8143571.1 exodeoxyribonuclease VII small subunit [Pseudomonadota bacterium]MEC8348154.1 exodeoxyribonuclease VII small subunit [Pseudomonadota bacterium]MEC8437409.1 exodeoxyribonuclease VII small subunit [Pseudomonadota bacterium]MEC8492555.1 exodeoxyribonuclease VII small subunit [Pseudomonadota bacterium]|tara:strand:+ start:60 stop:305 length:246 start_codon:yes stop_codon:yes gene_type:complete
MSKTIDPTSDDELTFEEAMAELDELVSRMEDGELSLDDSLKAFERGVMLTRKCQEALSQAELRVKTLTDADTLEELGSGNE